MRDTSTACSPQKNLGSKLTLRVFVTQQLEGFLLEQEIKKGGFVKLCFSLGFPYTWERNRANSEAANFA